MSEPGTNKVPAPWTPVELELSTTRAVAKVWGRTYTWDNSLLPTSIVTAGKELLARPAELHAHFKKPAAFLNGHNEQEEPFTIINYTPHHIAEDKVSFVAGGTAGNIIVNIRYTIEYDGFIEMDMSVIPYWQFAKDPLDSVPWIDGLYFEFPIKKSHSTLYHYWPNGESGIIADQDKMGSGAISETGLHLPFKPYVWSGWEFGGLGIATESDENVQLTPGTPCITIDEQEDCRVLRWNLFNKTPWQWQGEADRWIEALAPIDYLFGLQATPVKELRKDRTDIRIHHIGYDNVGKCLEPDENGENMFDKYKKANVTWVIFSEAWSSIQNYGQAENEELFKTYIREYHKRGIKVLAYFGYEFSTNSPMWRKQKDNYLIKTPNGHFVGGWQRLNQCQRDYMVCYAGGYSDVMCERIRYVLEHYDVDGIYTDGTHIPWECANEAHGCGYTDRFGARHTTFPIWALREHSKKMYEAVHSKPGAINETHQSSCLIAGTIGFADCFFNGESIQSSLQKGFTEFLNLPAFRVEFMGHNIGVFTQMLCGLKPDIGLDLEKFNSLCLIHDVLPATGGTDCEYMSKFWNEMSDFGSSYATWHPYWIEDRPVKVETENAYCSVYEKDGKYLAAVSSFNEDVDEVVLTFDGDVQVDYDVLGMNAAVADGNKLTVKMKAFKPNMIHLTKK